MGGKKSKNQKLLPEASPLMAALNCHCTPEEDAEKETQLCFPGLHTELILKLENESSGYQNFLVAGS